MEPLAGFFILEGLTFDIIGAILIIRGLKEFFIDDNSDNEILSKISKAQHYIGELSYGEKKLKNILKSEIMDIPQKQGQLKIIEQELKTVKDVKERTSIYCMLLYNSFEFLELSKKNDNIFLKSLQGLPFLVGGFMLQTIGVINQLV